MKRNPAFGHWTEEETNWSEKDTAFLNAVIGKDDKGVPTSYKQLKELHESLPY